MTKNRVVLGLLLVGTASIIMAFTTTNNMGLKIPATGDTDYPTSISDSFNAIDTHDHTSTKGVQIPTGGIADAAITGAKLNSAIVDNSTIEINANTLRVKDGGITHAKLAGSNTAVSSFCGSADGPNFIYTSSSTSAADVTNCSITLTAVANRGIFISLIGGANNTEDNPMGTSGFYFVTGARVGVLLVKDGTIIQSQRVSDQAPVSSVSFFDPSPSAGSHTYKIQIENPTYPTSVSLWNAKLYGFEI